MKTVSVKLGRRARPNLMVKLMCSILFHLTAFCLMLCIMITSYLKKKTTAEKFSSETPKAQLSNRSGQANCSCRTTISCLSSSCVSRNMTKRSIVKVLTQQFDFFYQLGTHKAHEWRVLRLLYVFHIFLSVCLSVCASALIM